jgi:hypothetical protein
MHSVHVERAIFDPLEGHTHQAYAIGPYDLTCPTVGAVQCGSARHKASERAPTKRRLTAQVASKLNQLRDTNFSPR